MLNNKPTIEIKIMKSKAKKNPFSVVVLSTIYAYINKINAYAILQKQ